MVYDFPNFVDPTPDDPVDKSDIMIFHLQEINKTLVDENASLKTQMSTLNDKFDTLIHQGEKGNISLGDSNTQVLNTLKSIDDRTSELQTGSYTLVTYGVYLIPFCIIVFLLWRFFSTFLRSAR